jgi:HK97 family phage portal protein
LEGHPVSAFFGKTETRGLTWDDVFGRSPGSVGVSFAGRHDAALAVVPVYAAVSLIADQFSVLPISCYQGGLLNSTKIKSPGFIDNPNPAITPMDWRYQLAVSLKLRGNAYGYITGSGEPQNIIWIHPDRVQVNERGGEIPEYVIGGKPEHLWQHGGRILHVREFIQPGSVKGLSPIAQFRSTFETSAAASKFGLDYFNNSANPSGLLKSKGKLKPGQAAEAKDIFIASSKGHEPVVLDSEWDWQSLAIQPEEAQFLATIKASATMVAAIFRVQPEDIGGESGNSKTYSNREMDQELFNVRTLLPLTTRVELALRVLLPDGQFVKFNMDALSRPNLIDRSKANTENLRNGSKTLAQVRKQEDEPPLTEAEVAFWQANYQTQKSAAESISEAVSTSITKES